MVALGGCDQAIASSSSHLVCPEALEIYDIYLFLAFFQQVAICRALSSYSFDLSGHCVGRIRLDQSGIGIVALSWSMVSLCWARGLEGFIRGDFSTARCAVSNVLINVSNDQ